MKKTPKTATFPNFPFTPEQLAWMELLVSGKLEQGIGCLQGDGNYCCLGVAMESLGIRPDGNSVSNPNYTNVAVYHVMVYPDAEPIKFTTSLPMYVWKKLQLKSNFGAISPPVEVRILTKSRKPITKTLESLAQLNDVHGYTFEKIVEFMRKYPDRVFTNLTPEVEALPVVPAIPNQSGNQ